MLTVKFMKYTADRSATEQVCLVSAKSVAIEYEKELRTIVKTESPQGGEYTDVSVGADNCAWHRAYVMNEAGRTVEVIS